MKPNTHRFVQFITDNTLDLSRQFLTDDDMSEIIDFLHQYPEITQLDLSLNNIGDQGLADFSERNQTVTRVNFNGNIISDLGVAIFAFKNLSVKWVNFANNPISDKGIESFIKINDMCSSSHFSSIQYH